ncbi:MAG: ThiF family adenylyltransferase [Legionellales bacterium]|jgi:molybdopterin/thiamine biosynthesis adenylyltransferase
MNTPENSAFYQQFTQKNIGVYSHAQQERLKQARIIILGLGGVGGLEAMLAARHGVGHITGVDPDTFETSNINRQMFAYTDTLGESKAAVAERELKRINPELRGEFLSISVDEHNAHELIAGHDLVLEALDDMCARVCVHRAAQKLGIPSISMSGSPPHRGFISSFLPGGIDYETLLGLPSQGKPLTDEIKKSIREVKNKRAQYSVQLGAPQSWADDYCEGKAGWIITPIRAALLATFSVHEAIQILVGLSPLAAAPKALLIDLDNLESPVRVASPEHGVWPAEQF